VQSDHLASEVQRNQRKQSLSGPIRKMATGFSLILAIFAFSVAGYVLSGWELENAVYMTVITIFGVGYGETEPVNSTAVRVLTITVIVTGYCAVIYTVGGFIQMLIDGELQNALGARRMSMEIDKLNGHTIICGVGRMGSNLAKELAAAGKPFVLVDADERRLQTAEELGYLVIDGDATDEEVLEAAGIRRANVLATVLPNDVLNVFVTITARDLNAKLMIIARGENPRTEKKLISSGANRVLLPTAVGAKKLAQMIIRPSAENMLERLAHDGDVIEELEAIGLEFHELEVASQCYLVGGQLENIQLSSNHGFLIVGLKRTSGDTILNPEKDEILDVGDIVIFLARKEDFPKLEERFAATSEQASYRGFPVEPTSSEAN